MRGVHRIWGPVGHQAGSFWETEKLHSGVATRIFLKWNLHTQLVYQVSGYCQNFAPYPGLGIRSFDLLIFDFSIFSIFKKDRPWSNCSCQFSKKIDRDRIALIDLLKRSTVIESILRSQKTIDSIEKPMVEFPTLPTPPPPLFRNHTQQLMLGWYGLSSELVKLQHFA